MVDAQNLIFGKYELIKRLALGGMGEVFLARQTGGVSGTERLVILKSLLPELAEQDGFVDQFLDEARVAAKLNHPNIVQMYEAGLWNGMHFIAMEYIRGDNLSRIQKVARARRIPLPIHLMVRIARDALLGLGHAHVAVDEMTGQPLTVVHRDVSPQNIMVRIDGVTKLVDFGIAKAANKLDRTKTGVLKGKLQFMSPEQVMGEDVDARTDQFAMGVVLWELLTGQRLFQGDNEIQILRAVSTQPIARPSAMTPGIPPELESVVMRMLDRDKTKRYASCAEAADELGAWLSSGSRRVGEADVAVFIKEVVGDVVDEATKNLTASENFLLSLHHTPTKSGGGKSSAKPSGETSPTVVRRMEEVKQRKLAGLGVALGVVAAVGLAGAAALVISGGDAPQQPPPQQPPQPPPPAPPAPMPPQRAKAKVQDGMVEIELADPPNASVIVDDQPHSARTPTTLKLVLGPHKIEIVDDSGRRTPVVVELPKPIVRIVTDPPGADLKVGDRSMGIAPATLDGKLESGLTHRLVVSKAGFASKEILVEDLKDGETRELSVKLEKKAVIVTNPREPPPPQPPTTVIVAAGVARLTVNIAPAAKVFLDGDLVGTTPLLLPKVPSGKHTLVLESTASAQKKKTVQITLKDGEDKKLPLTWD